MGNNFQRMHRLHTRYSTRQTRRWVCVEGLMGRPCHSYLFLLSFFNRTGSLLQRLLSVRFCCCEGNCILPYCHDVVGIVVVPLVIYTQEQINWIELEMDHVLRCNKRCKQKLLDGWILEECTMWALVVSMPIIRTHTHAYIDSRGRLKCESM